MEALVKRTDSFKKHDYFWIVGVNKKALWKQLDALQDCSSSCKHGNYYDIVAYRENGITTDAYTGQIIENLKL